MKKQHKFTTKNMFYNIKKQKFYKQNFCFPI